MYNDIPDPVIITISSEGHKMTQELPWDANAEELLHAFYTAAVGMTFDSKMFLESMRDFANNQLNEPDEETFEE